MTDATQSSVEETEASADGKAVAELSCRRCKRRFHPEKRSQIYCGNACRKKILALRKAMQRYAECLDTKPGMSASALRQRLDGVRAAAGLAALASDPLLKAQAELTEAEQQVQRWQAALQERRARVRALAAPVGLSVQRLVLRPGHGSLAIDRSWTHCAIAASDPQLAVILLARYTSPK